MLPQTKRIKDKLIDAGLKRKNLKVRTPCNKRGEYLKTKAYYHGPRERLLELKESVIEAGYSVFKITRDGELAIAGIRVPDYDEEPEFRETKLRE